MVGVAAVRESHLLAGTALVGFGVALAVIGVAILSEGRVLAGIAEVGLGVAVAVYGVAAVRDGATERRWIGWRRRITTDRTPSESSGTPDPQGLIGMKDQEQSR
ncbi:hypothetical protein Adi01nite_46370 [Amorphoplanes digitatis]|nr:hypothetical protein Adi01nite_46370 [Actinoplanes digitatis]